MSCLFSLQLFGSGFSGSEGKGGNKFVPRVISQVIPQIMILQLVIAILMIKRMTIILIMIMIIIIMMMTKVMIKLMIIVVIRQQYAKQCILVELDITAGHRSMTGRKHSMTQLNFLQLIHHILRLTKWLDCVSLFYQVIHSFSQNLHFLSTFKSFRKDILSKPTCQRREHSSQL